jgi:hypothetical protein
MMRAAGRANVMAWQLAQMNVGTATAALDSPQLADFMAALDGINALAEASAGFVWRLQDDNGNATSIKPSDNPRFIVNMSVWDSVEALFAFVYRSDHRGVMVRRREWFERPEGAYLVLWWVPAGARPTVAEGLARLRHLDENGATPHAFTFRTMYPHPDTDAEAGDMCPDPYCVGWS